MSDRTHIGRAHKIASELGQEGYSPTDGGLILSMALGIFMEGQADSHRNLQPIADAMLKTAQMAFDALRDSRNRDAGRA
jgi:hypothetical protein